MLLSFSQSDSTTISLIEAQNVRLECPANILESHHFVYRFVTILYLFLILLPTLLWPDKFLLN